MPMKWHPIIEIVAGILDPPKTNAGCLHSGNLFNHYRGHGIDGREVLDRRHFRTMKCSLV